MPRAVIERGMVSLYWSDKEDVNVDDSLKSEGTESPIATVCCSYHGCIDMNRNT